MNNLAKIEKEVSEIKARNARVERDKEWETSWIRRIAIGFLTYLVVSAYFFIIRVPSPFVSALVPSIAYIISTFGLGVLKKWWITKNKWVVRNYQLPQK